MNDNMVSKSSQLENQEITDSDLEKINKYTLKDLTKDDIFVFKVIISDNEVDRDYEVFPLSSLEKMKELFIGKTLIKDHQKKADNQVGRIYDTALVSSTSLTKNNEIYTQLIAYCYMVKTNSNQDLIKEIEAGIKKEVSVSLSVKNAVCSICGTDNMNNYCDHWWGKEYDGKTCTFSLENPIDAYEVSLVATPANANAGTTKTYKVRKEKAESNVSVLEKDSKNIVSLRLKTLQSFIFAEEEGNE